MDENRHTEDNSHSSASKHEDAVMKTMMQFFADELLPLLGIHEKVISIAPTELMDIRITNFYQDFNFLMEDSSIKHFEFQSSDLSLDDLKRFRSYEAVTSYKYKSAVTTYVVCSGKIKKPRTEFTEGINTYRIIPIRLAEWNADEFIRTLEEKGQSGKLITRNDLVLLTLSPIMSGDMTIKDRIKAAHKITKDCTSLPRWEMNKLEAVIYAMADKFLESMDMEEIKEDMRMTRLGQMLLNDGRTEGRIQGQTLNSVRIIRHKLEKGISADIVADFLEEDPDYIKQIYALIQSQPDLTDLQIAELVLNERKKDIN